ncbi:hypothetical protein D3C87_125330 [compost metagenome]
MAKVQAQVTGGSITQQEANTVSELKQKLAVASYQATVNGEPVEDTHTLREYDFVALTPKVKGA